MDQKGLPDVQVILNYLTISVLRTNINIQNTKVNDSGNYKQHLLYTSR